MEGCWIRKVDKKGVVVKGAGEKASAVGYFLFSKEFPVIMTEISEPTTQRRTVAFAEAIFSGETVVEGVKAKKARDLEGAMNLLEKGVIPVLVDPEASIVDELNPRVVVDARMAKENLGTRKDEAKLVIGLGPGFTAGEEVDIVIETAEGEDPGRVIHDGIAHPNTGKPTEIGGYTTQRILRAPKSGFFEAKKSLLDEVNNGESIGQVSGRDVKAGISGTIRGLVKDGLKVEKGQKLGDIDPRQKKRFEISPRSRKIAKGVYKAIRDSSLNI